MSTALRSLSRKYCKTTSSLGVVKLSANTDRPSSDFVDNPNCNNLYLTSSDDCAQS